MVVALLSSIVRNMLASSILTGSRWTNSGLSPGPTGSAVHANIIGCTSWSTRTSRARFTLLRRRNIYIYIYIYIYIVRLKVNGDGVNGYLRLKVNGYFKAQGKWLLKAQSKWLLRRKVNGDGVNGYVRLKVNG